MAKLTFLVRFVSESATGGSMLELICGIAIGAGVVFVLFWMQQKLHPLVKRSKARDLILEEMQEPIVLFGVDEKLKDFNREAADKFNLTNQDMQKMTRETFVTSVLLLEYQESPNPFVYRELVYQTEYSEIVYRLNALKMKFKDGTDLGRLYVFHDITKQKRMYNALENMSMFHALTGFYTSRTFEQRLEEMDKEKQQTVLGICNISSLKLLNKIYGRKLGDRIVQVMSEELRAVLPENALISYTEDDHVVIAATNMTEKQMTLCLENAVQEIKHKALPKVPVFMNFGVTCRENTSIPSIEYMKYAELDMVLKKAKVGETQKQQMTEALTKEYFRKNYESKEHVDRITKLSMAMAKKLQLPEKEQRRLELFSDSARSCGGMFPLSILLNC